jgi:hypothetical protein
MGAIGFDQAIPRIFSVDKAKEFYLDYYLGASITAMPVPDRMRCIGR